MRWINYGVALCEDVNRHLPENHPRRYKWMELASASGLENPMALNKYYNGGLVGLPMSCSRF
jgi:hypothetical protein